MTSLHQLGGAAAARAAVAASAVAGAAEYPVTGIYQQAAAAPAAVAEAGDLLTARR